MPPRSAGAAPSRVLVLARDPVVIAAARDAARRTRRSAALVETGQQALALMTAPGHPRHQLICDGGAAESALWPELLAAAAEQRGLTPLLVVSDHPVRLLPEGLNPLPPDSARLAAALGTDLAAGGLPRSAPAALRSALGRGEIGVRYQPIIDLADRRPVMVEALARWAPRYPPIGPDRFLPLAARAGLMRPLSMAVVRSVVQELGPLRRQLAVAATVNLPLDLLRVPDLPAWLKRELGRSALRPEHLFIELTEHAPIADRTALARTLNQLLKAGHGVFLDDIVLEDPRAPMFQLPFSGLKLDRSFVAALPGSARARHLARQLVRAADARGQVVVAEGATQLIQLRLLRELGIHRAQGFLIGRPLPAKALLSWSRLWRAGSAPERVAYV
jgi:EAL domain-containing protein (putative c-di-GMP-specific phosphodiesterase class I)